MLICEGCRDILEEHQLHTVPDYAVVGDDEPVFCGHIRLCGECKRAREDSVREATVAGFVALGIAAAVVYVASAWGG
jgi:hypothetical protein